MNPITGMQLFQMFQDFNIILKILVLVMIMSFVLNHLGKGPMAWIVMAILAYFVIFDSWKIFGPVYILYMVLALGFVGFLIDFFFMSTPLQARHVKGGEMEGPNSMDAKARQDILHKAPHGGGGHPPRAPPPG
ncbi:MAG: hypothetical protein V1777_01705 [Candidatus Micrarchaeota archaeon]